MYGHLDVAKWLYFHRTEDLLFHLHPPIRADETLDWVEEHIQWLFDYDYTS